MIIDEKYFKESVGHPPNDDDLERSNCAFAGHPLHFSCGWCSRCNLPIFICKHTHKINDPPIEYT